mmetsp:Transcript_85618/g.134548  ORF Transcript_85618/g.134548 Transcript_85618/m.134548 type:complete len:562 (-) Transcript_85618:68-1753(-)
MDWNVGAASDALSRVPLNNRPATASKLAMLLARRGCCSVKVYSLVTPLDLARALIPLLEESPLQPLVKAFADTDNQDQGVSISDHARTAAARTVSRLKGSGDLSSFFLKQDLKGRGLYLGSQAYALVNVKSEELVAELLRRGIVIEDSTTSRLQYSESHERSAVEKLTDEKPIEQVNKVWDWSFWNLSGVSALPENGSVEKPFFIVTDCSFPSSFFGRAGKFMAAFRQKFAAMGMNLELMLKENAIKFHYKGTPPPNEAVREIVLMIASPTAPAVCKYPARRGRVKGTTIDALSLKHDVRICRIGSVLHVWPTASLLPEIKKSELAGAVRTLRDLIATKCTEIDNEMRENFGDMAADQSSADKAQAYAERKARRAQRQAAHIQKVGAGSGNKLLSNEQGFKKNDRAIEMQRDKLKREQRKEHLQDRDWRKRYGGKVNRDKRPPMHGGRHKGLEGAVDDEGVKKLSELARTPSVMEDAKPNVTASELKDILHEMADLWCAGASSKPTAKYKELKSSLTHQQVRAWNDAVVELGEVAPDAQTLAVKAFSLFRASEHRDSLNGT